MALVFGGHELLLPDPLGHLKSREGPEHTWDILRKEACRRALAAAFAGEKYSSFPMLALIFTHSEMVCR
jgi:hypothetical protein